MNRIIAADYEQARQLFAYDPNTGALTWRRKPRIRAIPVGAPAGYIDTSDGYRRARIGNKLHLAQRIIWLIQKGEWPPGPIKHVDAAGPKADWGNRWSNLELLDPADNPKQSARYLIRKAVQTGKLSRPSVCSRCGTTKQTSNDAAYIQAHHHNGYDKPMDIEWLCMACHSAEHGPLRGVSNGRAKLTPEKIHKIRNSAIPAGKLGLLYGVHRSTIARIKRGERWSHL